MAAKRFGAVLLSNDQYLCVAEGNVGYDATVTVQICNQSSGENDVTLAYTVNTFDPPNSDFILFNRKLTANETLEIRGIALEGGYSLVARSCLGSVSVVVYGFEEIVGA